MYPERLCCSGMAKEPIQGEASHTGKSSKEFSVGSKPSSNLTRWAHSIFPTAMDTDWFAVALEDIPPWIAYEPHEETRVVEMQRQIIWNNLLEPSILPLTTEFAPNSIFSKSYFVQVSFYLDVLMDNLRWKVFIYVAITSEVKNRSSVI